MREELDKKLCEQFPDIFRDRNAPMSQTCMCWGFGCGDGWYSIIEAACRQIQGHIKNTESNIEWAEKFNTELAKAEANGFEDWPDWKSKEPRKVPEPVEPVVATQIKEKFGTLRFYYRGGDEFVDGVVSMAASMSARICEVCGAPATLEQEGGWVRTRCKEHN